MPSLTPGEIRRLGLAACAAGALLLGLGAAPARAGDDGEAPLWVGIESMFGFGGDGDKETIEYRDRGKLVLPPKVELPPPAAAPFKGNAAWPVDQEEQRRKKEKEESARAVYFGSGKRAGALMDPHGASVVTMDATAGQGPGGHACGGGPGDVCKTKTGQAIYWNPLTWVGLEK